MSHPYASAAYAAGLSHVGAPFEVPEWGGHVLVRPTPSGEGLDAAGPYPLTMLTAEADVAGGLLRLKAAGAVSAVIVLDAARGPPAASAEAAFDFARPFKAHFFHDRAVGPLELQKHHRYELRRAMAEVSTREIRLADHAQDWLHLYAALEAKHDVGGVHAFPAAHHHCLAQLPGVRTFGAFVEDRLVSAHLFITHAGYAVSHLAASTPEGYAARAAYAVNARAILELEDCDLINFGGASGAQDDPTDGLARFKRGFSNRVAASKLCGSVLDPKAYESLSSGFEGGAFFPAYRGLSRTGASQ